MSIFGGGFEDITPVGPQWRDVELGDEAADDFLEGDVASDEVPLAVVEVGVCHSDMKMGIPDRTWSCRMEVVCEDLGSSQMSEFVLVSGDTDCWRSGCHIDLMLKALSDFEDEVWRGGNSDRAGSQSSLPGAGCIDWRSKHDSLCYTGDASPEVVDVSGSCVADESIGQRG
ncbi:MAG: hypothetical protein H0T91_06265 [Propionibacteriaceae bacterium]|nr:hypothetical protein [Propionibacteriaceae bacterium]